MAPTHSFNFHSTSEEVVEAFRDQIQGRTFLVTGVSVTGLGAYAATALARGGPAHVILVGRNKAKIEPVMAEIAAIDADIRTTFVQCSLDDFESVRAAAVQINAVAPRIHVVLNNAGIMAQPYAANAQGIESQFAANHVGHFLLTNLIIDRVMAAAEEGSERTGGARIVNHSSLGHKISPVRFDDPGFSGGKTYDKWAAYGQSKTANILHAVELSRRLRAKSGGKDSNFQAFAVHPGEIWSTQLAVHVNPDTDLGAIDAATSANGLPPFRAHSKPKSVSQGAMTMLVAALDPALAGYSAAWLADGQIQAAIDPHGPGPFMGWNEARQIQIEPVYGYATDEANAARLWKLTEELIGQKFDL